LELHLGVQDQRRQVYAERFGQLRDIVTGADSGALGNN
jgi:hypothetical protein